MKLAEKSHLKVQDFFRIYLQDDHFALPQVHFYAGKFTHFFTTLISVNGITFGKRVFIFPQILSLSENKKLKLPEELVVHEIAHVLQYRREGLIGFLYKYLRDYWRNLRVSEKWDKSARQQAYIDIPFEIEAREAAYRYAEWKQSPDSKTEKLPPF